MESISALQDYLKKIQRTIDNAGLTLFSYKFVKKNRMDDLLVCAIASMPESYRNIMNKKIQLDLYPSVACYNQLTRVIKKSCFLFSDYYMVDYTEAFNLLKSLKLSIERDIRKLEEQL